MAELGIPLNSARPANLVGASVGRFLCPDETARDVAGRVHGVRRGMMLAPGSRSPVLASIADLCIAVGAGASGALNMWYDADIDARMQRTGGPTYSARGA